jgi:hypothetical protein
MEQGWIYVLVNSSIPGLTKVGRTTRPPDERAAELSAATGVATPFVVAFQQDFPDCIAAEQWVHGALDRRGLRVAPNREFFRGSPGEVVRVVLQCAAAAGDAPVLQPARSAADLLADGERHMCGSGETLQDVAEAVHCFRLAAARGSLVAVERLGMIFMQMRGSSRANRRRAMRHLKDGAGRGNYYCYCEMARLFAEEGHLENFTKAWNLFFCRRDDAFLPEVEQGAERYPTALRTYVATCLALGIAPGHLPELRAAVDALVRCLLTKLDQVRDAPEARAHMALVLRWSYENLVPAAQQRLRPLGRWPKIWTSLPRGAAA